MTLSVTHSYVSSVGETTPSGGPGGTVGPIEWNANHTITGILGIGTGLTSGLGITYFSSATVLADSGTLTANALLVGGGANGAPTSITSGTTSQVLHGNASGNPSFGSVDLGSEVSGTLPVARGGTNSSTIGSSGQIIFNNSGGLAGMSGTSWDNTNLALSITGSTALAASNPIFNLTQGWNAAGVTFTALKLNVTNTASAAASLLMDLQVGGSTKANFREDGQLQLAGQLVSIGSPGIVFGGGYLDAAAASVAVGWNVGQIIAGSSGLIGFSSTSSNAQSGGANNDTVFARDAAGILAQRNGTNAQTLRVYNTFTDASNYERGVFDWGTNSNVLTIGTQSGGTGSVRNVNITAPGNAAFHFGVGTGKFSVDTQSGAIAIATGGGFFFALSGSSGFNLASGASGDVGLGRIAAKVLGISDGAGNNANGWPQWGGQARVTANVTSTTTSLTNISGLTATLANGRNYSFNCEVIGTCSSSGGVQLALNTTSTSTGYTLLIDGYAIDGGNSVRGYSQQTAVGTAVIASTITNTSFHASLWGTITTSSSMVVNFQMAQQNLSATQTIAQRGSHSFFHDMP